MSTQNSESRSPEQMYLEAAADWQCKQTALCKCNMKVIHAQQELILAQAEQVQAQRDVDRAERHVNELRNKARSTLKYETVRP